MPHNPNKDPIEEQLQQTMLNEKEEENSVDVPIISDPSILLQYGICKVSLPKELDAAKWAKELSQVTPEILLGQGDDEYAFYRNILEEPDFPFDCILKTNDDDDMSSPIAKAILQYFPIQNLERELQLDDAFCVHYNMNQDDTSGSKHMDPSDITVNMCLEKSKDTKGSHVLFYGTKALENITTHPSTGKASSPKQFLVLQEPGYATIHYGDHPHETTTLEQGRRTNVILTYCYTDPTRSDVATRACY